MKALLIIIGVAFATITTQAQSLLTQPIEPPAQAAARAVLATPKQTKEYNLAALKDAFGRIWANPDATPQEVLDSMGTNAAQLFAINTAWLSAVRAFLASQGDDAAVAQIDALAALVPPCTVHEDGTVTINPPNPPEQ